MDRRKFLGLLAAAPVAAAVVPARGCPVAPLPPRTVSILRTIRDRQLLQLSEVVETLKLGDIFTVPGYYAVNPLTLKCTELLQVFTVTEIGPRGPIARPRRLPT